MSRKLSETNTYLRDPAVRKRAIFQSVASSSAIEGIHAPFRKVAAASDKRKPASTDHRKRQPRTA